MDRDSGGGHEQEEDRREWAPLTQAADAYGVSVDTIRRRIKRRELDTRREMTPQGFRWLVPLPQVDAIAKSGMTLSEAPGSSRSDVAPVYGPHIIPIPDPASVELIATLQRELEERNAEIGRLHEEIERFHDTITQQAQTIDRTVAMLPAIASPLVQETPPSGLWSRLRRWVVGEG